MHQDETLLFILLYFQGIEVRTSMSPKMNPWIHHDSLVLPSKDLEYRIAVAKFLFKDYSSKLESVNIDYLGFQTGIFNSDYILECRKVVFANKNTWTQSTKNFDCKATGIIMHDFICNQVQKPVF